MIDGVSSSEQTQAVSRAEASLLAVRNEAQQQQQLADTVARQAEQQQAAQPASNPEGVGGNVDTYA